MRSVPYVTLALCFCCTGLMLLPLPWQQSLYYQADAITQGNFLVLFTGQLMHSDASHWFWNTLALAVIGTYLERRSRALLVTAVLVGLVSVDLLLLSPLSELDYYCGFSGALNTLLGVALYCHWRDTRSYWVVFAAALCAAKVVLEWVIETSLFTDIAWPPYPPAHFVGLLGACVLLLLSRRYTELSQPEFRLR